MADTQQQPQKKHHKKKLATLIASVLVALLYVLKQPEAAKIVGGLLGQPAPVTTQH